MGNSKVRSTKKEKRLVIIGGHEDRQGPVIQEVARYAANGNLVVATVASEESVKLFESYRRAFVGVDAEPPEHLSIDSREEALDPRKLEILRDATGVFFTGGDQLRITSQIGDTPIEHRIREIYDAGGVIAGTSAGASAMCGTMLVRGRSRDSQRPDNLRMAPGLGFIRGVIIDQHFAERGRMARLLGAVALNPRELGIGIDEDTAIIVKGDKEFLVIGSGAVYVIDGSTVTQSNIADDTEESPALSVYDFRLHILARGDAFDLREQRPKAATAAEKKHLDKIEWHPEQDKADSSQRSRSGASQN